MTMGEDIEGVKEATKRVLANSERARNNDIYLIFRVLEILDFARYDFAKEEFELELDKEDISEMPSPESITRNRRKFQEQGLFEPKKSVVKARENQEKVVREKMRS